MFLRFNEWFVIYFLYLSCRSEIFELAGSRAGQRRYLFTLLVVLVSGLVWIAAWQASSALLSFTVLNSGVTLVYLPAGIRLAILLIAGLAGAAGIALVFPLALLQVFSGLSVLETATYALIAGFVPYATVAGVCRAYGIAPDLRRLRSSHLPLLAAAVSITGAASYTIALVAFGRFPAQHFLSDVTAMAAGDFLGCFAIVALIRLLMRGYRALRR